MNKILIIGVMSLLFIGITSAYYCIGEPTDNQQVMVFKNNINQLILQKHIEDGWTEEQIAAEIKLINPCNR